MPSDPHAMVRITASFERFTDRLAEVAQQAAEFRAALAFTSLPTAERWVAGMPRIHYADHLTGQEGDDA